MPFDFHDPDCMRCPLSAGARARSGHVCVPGDGPAQADIMFIGRDPGEQEERENRPFVGAAGRQFAGMLMEAGLRREDVYVSNIVRCRPPGNRVTTTAEIAACRMYTVREIEAVQPKVIIALGGVTAKELIGKVSIQDSRGSPKPLRSEYRYDCPVVVTYHPAAGLHNPREAKQIRDAIVTDMRLAVKAISPDIQPVEIATSYDVRAAVTALKKIAKASIIACDGEWTVVKATYNGRDASGGRPWTRRNGKQAEMLCVGLAAEVNGEQVAVSIKVEQGPLMAAVHQIINRIPTIFHNAPADLPWLMSLGMKPLLGDDTLILASLLNLQHSLKLATLTGVLTDIKPGWKDDTKKTLGTKPLTHEEWLALLIRNGKDCIATLALRDSLHDLVEKMGRQKVLPLYRELLKATISLARVALRGVPMNEELLAQLHERTRTRITDLKERIAVELNVPEFAVPKAKGAALKMAYALEQALGKPLPRTPKNNQPSMTKGWLADNAQKHPVIPKLMRLSGYAKLDGTYFGPWEYMLHEQGDGRLHTDYKLWLARTGRTSAEQEIGGTIQQFPRDKRIRALVRAAQMGWSILSGDLAQIELRIAAWIANEDRLLYFFQHGIDPHKATAAWIAALSEGLTLNQFLTQMTERMARVTPDQRQAAKAVNFGFLFGMRERKFIATARREYGVTFTMAQATIAREGYFTLYPKLRQWHDDSWRWVRLGYVETPFGRKRPLVLTEKEDEEGLWRKALNTPVQSTASDLALMSLPEIELELESTHLTPHCFPLGFIHDQNLAEVRDGYFADVREIVIKHMTHPPVERLGIELPVPLEVEVKAISRTWS